MNARTHGLLITLPAFLCDQAVEGLHVRASPSLTAPILTTALNGEAFTVAGGPTAAGCVCSVSVGVNCQRPHDPLRCVTPPMATRLCALVFFVLAGCVPGSQWACAE